MNRRVDSITKKENEIVKISEYKSIKVNITNDSGRYQLLNYLEKFDTSVIGEATNGVQIEFYDNYEKNKDRIPFFHINNIMDATEKELETLTILRYENLGTEKIKEKIPILKLKSEYNKSNKENKIEIHEKLREIYKKEIKKLTLICEKNNDILEEYSPNTIRNIREITSSSDLQEEIKYLMLIRKAQENILNHYKSKNKK